MKRNGLILFVIGFFAILFSCAQTKAATQLGWDQRYKSFKSYKSWFIEAAGHYGVTLNGSVLYS